MARRNLPAPGGDGATRQGAWGEVPGRIFLLSHMRAFTSLAGHVLGSHPEISGYFELHMSYEDATALERQRVLLAGHDGIKPESRWLFDKLLHDDFRLLPERLGPVALRLLLCLREPVATLGSIVRLFSGRGGSEPYATPEGATAYYVRRLKTLAAFAAERPGRYCYFDAELWQAAPEVLLPRLARWLELTSPLSDVYRTYSQTGRPGRGDSSPRIYTGRIDRTPHDYSSAGIPEALLEQARQTYRRCRATIVACAADALTRDAA